MDSKSTNSTDEKEILSATNQWEMSFDAVTDLIAIIDNNHKITQCNFAMANKVNKFPEEIVGLHCYELIHGTTEPPSFCPHNRLLSDGKTHSVEITEEKLGGVCFVTATPLYGSNGSLSGCVHVVHEISEQKKIYATLRKNEAQLQSILRSVPIGICLVSDKLLRWTNDKFLEITGYSGGEMEGQSVRILYPDDEEYEFVGRENFRQIKERGTGNIETLFVRKDGTIIDVLLTSTPINPSDLSAGITFSVQDITEHKESEETFSKAFHSNFALMGISTVDEGRILAVNDQFLQKLEYKREEVLEKTSKELGIYSNPNQRDVFLKIIKEEGRIKNIEMDLCSKSGKIYHGLFSADIINIKSQQYLLTIFNDITERIEAKKTLEKNEELQALLIQAQKMEALGTLSGGIAHDFNNILSGIIGLTELTLDEVKKGSSVETYLKEMLKAETRATDLISQILTFSRHADREMKPVKLKSIAKEALKLLSASLPSTIKIQKNIKSESIIWGDPTHFHQIFLNLCTNASHAMEGIAGVLKIDLIDVDLDERSAGQIGELFPGRHIKLTIKDTGHGIDPDKIYKIFDPYFTTKEVDKGTGLGLSVVHGIVAIYEGVINVKSDPGKGSAFTIYLPVFEQKIEAEEIAGTELPRGRESILVVDDETIIVKSIQLRLSKLGYQVETFSSPLNALLAFKLNPDKYDLVLTDMAMPDMMGDNLAKALIRIKPDMPVILCTGYSEKISEETAKKIGIKEFLIKPVTEKKLSEVIRKVLDQN